MTAVGPAVSTGTVAGEIVARLELHGVRHVFGIPGMHNLPLYEALGRSTIAHIAPRHEQGAGYAADGYARATGNAGVCFVTSGPGLTNILTALATAHSDSVPLLVLSPGMPDALNGHDTGFLHELHDQHGMVSRIVHSVRANTSAQAIDAIDETFARLHGARPRPAHIEIPLDRFDAPADSSFAPVRIVPPVPDNGEIERAAESLATAIRPAIVLGGGAKDAGREALALARVLGAPTVTTVNGKGAISEHDPLSLGASIRLGCIQQFLQERDVLLVVGSELGESDLWRSPPLECAGTIIRVDIDSGQLQKNAASELPIHGDAALTLELIAELTALIRPERAPEDLTALRAAMLAEAREDGRQFEALVDVLSGSLRPDAIIASDSTMACYYGLVHFLAQAYPRQLLYPTGFATLGYGLPAAIGAKLACPDRQVLALLGDGGVLFTIQELATAVEQRLQIPIVIVNNGGYGEIKRGMLKRGMEPMAVDLTAPDFVRIAEGFGARGRRANGYEDLRPLLDEAFAGDGPTVIEVTEEVCT